MKIVHFCLACFYIEGMEYQENVMPRKHRQLGHDVEIVTSQFCFDTTGKVFYREVGEYVNKDDVKVRIIPYDTKTYGKYAKKYGIFPELYKTLEALKPDIVFCHGGQFNVRQVVRYIKDNPNVRLYMDSHADYFNSPIDTFKKNMYQRYLWGRQYRKLEPYCRKMWGTLPWRVQYMKEVYNVRSDKVQLLVMGGDVEKLGPDEKQAIRNRVRGKYDISDSTFMMVAGGKIDKKKNIHLLMEAVAAIKDRDIKLVVFGEPTEDARSLISRLANSEKTKMVGWLSPEECYALFYAADLAVFPGTHSVLWEQVCACELPALFRGTEGQNHVDMGGNCQFLYKDDAGEIKTKILDIIDKPELYSSMKKVAVEKGYNTFSYMEISKKAIEIQ
jgi:1,2-diacylglycerol 3-alpha-glucosyltransferase